MDRRLSMCIVAGVTVKTRDGGCSVCLRSCRIVVPTTRWRIRRSPYGHPIHAAATPSLYRTPQRPVYPSGTCANSAQVSNEIWQSLPRPKKSASMCVVLYRMASNNQRCRHQQHMCKRKGHSAPACTPNRQPRVLACDCRPRRRLAGLIAYRPGLDHHGQLQGVHRHRTGCSRYAVIARR